MCAAVVSETTTALNQDPDSDGRTCSATAPGAGCSDTPVCQSQDGSATGRVTQSLGEDD
jgi:hypothetical protein